MRAIYNLRMVPRTIQRAFCLMLLALCLLPVSTAADEQWRVTIEDFLGGNNGTIITHEVTPDSIVSSKSLGNGEPPEKLGTIELSKAQRASIVKALNKVKVGSLKKEYRPEQPIFDGTWVGFTFDLPDRKPVSTTVYQGAYHRSLKNIVRTMNKVLPDDLRIRGMDRS